MQQKADRKCDAASAGVDSEAAKEPGVEIPSEDVDSSSYYARRSCAGGIKLQELRSHLFAIQARTEGNRQIAEHIEQGCDVCEKRVLELRATEPFLRGDNASRLNFYYSKHLRNPQHTRVDKSGDVREELLLKLTETLMRAMTSNDGSLTLATAVELVNEFFASPVKRSRGVVLTECKERYKSLDPEVQRQARGLWEHLLDRIMADQQASEITLGRHSHKVLIAFLLSALSEDWIIAAEHVPWTVTAISEEEAEILIHPKTVLDCIDAFNRQSAINAPR